MHRFALIVALACVPACTTVEDAPAQVTPAVTISPREATAGSPLQMTYSFATATDAAPLDPRTRVFVHFLDDVGRVIWMDDHNPPVRADTWKADSTVMYTRTVFIPGVSYIGDTDVEVGLYVPDTGARVPLRTAAGTVRTFRAGTLALRLQTESPLITFARGWYPPEGSVDGAEPQWRWSSRRGTLSFRNPRRDIVVLLDTDEPLTDGGVRTSSVYVGTTRVASFPLTPRQRQLLRLPISRQQLGNTDPVMLTLAVDRTIVPARILPTGSPDTRPLGVRVFHAYVQPN